MKRKRKNNPRQPPRVDVVVYLPTDTARVIIETAEIEKMSVSRIITETLVAVFGPFKRRGQ